MRFKKLKIAIAIGIILFIFIVGNIIIFGALHKDKNLIQNPTEIIVDDSKKTVISIDNAADSGTIVNQNSQPQTPVKTRAS